MPQIPRETIDQLRNQVDIADVISQDIQLKKQGKNLMGHCPFHEDATPSFSVNEENSIFIVSPVTAAGTSLATWSRPTTSPSWRPSNR